MGIRCKGWRRLSVESPAAGRRQVIVEVRQIEGYVIEIMIPGRAKGTSWSYGAALSVLWTEEVGIQFSRGAYPSRHSRPCPAHVPSRVVGNDRKTGL